MTPSLATLVQQRFALQNQLAELGDFRAGSKKNGRGDPRRDFTGAGFSSASDLPGMAAERFDLAEVRH